MAVPSEIFTFTLQLGVRISMPGDWHYLKAPGEFFQLELSRPELAKRLKSQFQMPDLLQSGAFVANQNQKPAMNSLLHPGALLFALKTMPTGDILGAEFFALSGRWALSAVFDNDRFENYIRSLEALIVVPTVLDAAVLRAAGQFPAIPIEPVYHLAEDGLDGFRQLLMVPARDSEDDWGRVWRQLPKPGFNQIQFPANLILCNWSVAKMDRADVPKMLELADELREIHQFAELDLSGFEIWKPSENDLKKLTFSLKRRLPTLTRQTVYQSLTSSVEPLVENGLHRRAPRSYLEASRQWLAEPDERSKQRLWKQVEEFLRQEVTEPLLLKAAKTADPLKRNSLLTVAELSSVSHLLANRVTSELAQWRGTNSQGGRCPYEQDLEQYLSVVDRQRTITRDTLQWPTPKRATAHAQPMNGFSSSLDSTRPNAPR